MMKWLSIIAALLAQVILMFYFFDKQYKEGYQAGVTAAQEQHEEEQRTALAKHQSALADNLKAANAAERSYLEKQQRLNQQNQQLKEQLYEALDQSIHVRTHGCTVGTEWMQHYRQALGISRVPTTNTNGSHTARGVADAAITPAELLQHLTDYGHWCRANTEQLTALQNLIKQLNYGQE